MLRAAKSIPRNIAEGNEKQSLKDQNRFFQIARGSALECAAIDDILLSFQAIVSKPIRSRRKLSSTSTRKTDEKKTPNRMCSLQRPFFPLTLGTPF